MFLCSTPLKNPAPHNRTLTCSPTEIAQLQPALLTLATEGAIADLDNQIMHQDCFQALPHLPQQCIDLLILDPPYNLAKNYHGYQVKVQSQQDYQDWFASLIAHVKPTLKDSASLYVCADWKTSMVIVPLLNQHFVIRNRITWEREKGRGAKANWKNTSEDIWFCTCSADYTFNVEAVKLKRRVMAPYRDRSGNPKDWQEEVQGNYRLTHPSNLWTDISVPFWSMAENTHHPTQKPEKLMAKLILASSNPDDRILDPFLGSGTTAVVARKLDRRFVAMEQNLEYCCWALKRLEQARQDPSIQGYGDGVFWERNTKLKHPKPPPPTNIP